VTSITPPSGIRELYIYDTANRLKEVKDITGNILKTYEYHYKP
ncbi:YD repeat-containing protein, partial [Chryseobacterium sp. MDT2-18]|nr:YD repeat-containing protein [Chryseobacterium sp. MDT2-18]